MSSHMSNYHIYILALSAFYLAYSQAHEYRYPIAAFSESSIGFIYQSSQEKIELYTWDSLTRSVEPSLHSHFSPAHITLLPDNQGFSFIDNGIIRIKLFHKRSPKSLGIAQPMYNINALVWEKERANMVYGYFSAQYQEHYALARIDLDAHISHIIFSQKSDFLYPQKRDDTIFFIARSIEDAEVRYRLCKLKFDLGIENTGKKITDRELDSVQELKTTHREISQAGLLELVFMDFNTQPIYFLAIEREEIQQEKLEKLVAEKKLVGYVVAYACHTDNHATFSYYQIAQEIGSCGPASQDQERWSKKKLFDFSLPTSFLVTQGQHQLYEHIMPLLPKKIGDTIYFSHATYSPTVSDSADLGARESNINIFSYDLGSAEIKQITHACEPDEHYFCPLKCGQELYYGGTVLPKHT